MDILITIFIIWFLLFIICICFKEAREGFYTFKEDFFSPNWKDEFTEIIGVPYYFHMNRHYCCSMMLGDYNLPPDVVREWNSWNDLSLLQIYNDRSAFDDFGKYFSADGIIAQEQKGLADLK
mgnify:CR=1 FL=1